MLKWKQDAILSVVLMIACAAGILYSNTMTSDMIKLRAAQPDVYLKLWLGIMLVLSAMLLVKTLRERSEEVVEKLWGPLQIFTVVRWKTWLLRLRKSASSRKITLRLFYKEILYEHLSFQCDRACEDPARQ